jgi:small subunit ribosomal protein S4
MARYIQPLCKKCRRLGVKLFLKGDKCLSDKCPMQRRSYIPGQHGLMGRKGKITDYGAHLIEKQKAKFHYGLMEEQFRRYFEKASRQRKIPTGERLIQLLEKRLDNVLYRAGVGTSRQMSRQFVLHKKVYVNGKSVNIPSYSVRAGDKVTFKDSLKNNVYALSFKERNISPPAWMNIDKDKWEIEILKEPSKEEVSVPFNEQLIVEFYSK